MLSLTWFIKKPIKCSVLNGFRQVINLNFRRPHKIGDGSRYLQNPVIGPGAQAQICHSFLQQLHALRIERAVFAQQSRRHPRITGYLTLVAEPFELNKASASNPFPDRSRWLLERGSSQIFELHCRHFDVNIYSVHQWSRQTVTVFLHLRRCAPAFSAQISVVSTGTWIHRSNQHELGWKSERPSRP